MKEKLKGRTASFSLEIGKIKETIAAELLDRTTSLVAVIALIKHMSEGGELTDTEASVDVRDFERKLYKLLDDYISDCAKISEKRNKKKPIVDKAATEMNHYSLNKDE